MYLTGVFGLSCRPVSWFPCAGLGGVLAFFLWMPRLPSCSPDLSIGFPARSSTVCLPLCESTKLRPSCSPGLCCLVACSSVGLSSHQPVSALADSQHRGLVLLISNPRQLPSFLGPFDCRPAPGVTFPTRATSDSAIQRRISDVQGSTRRCLRWPDE